MWGRVCAVFLLVACLPACGSIFPAEPIAIGRDRDALKQNPCACYEIEQTFAAWRRLG